MFKKTCCLFLSVILLMFSVPMNIFAAESSVSNVPKTVNATLVSDSGKIFNVIGEKVNNPIKPFSVDTNNESATYKFSLYSNPEYTLTATKKDGSLSVEVFLTINYVSKNSPAEYLLTSVSGKWNIFDRRVSVSQADLTYGCIGRFPSLTNQHELVRDVKNNFSYQTGFSKYVINHDTSTMGANLEMKLSMGSTRHWNFSVNNNAF